MLPPSTAALRNLSSAAKLCYGAPMKLYSYFRSSAAYRVRIALNLKGVSYETVPIHLIRDGGEQHKKGFRAVNPQGRVPALELDDGAILIQSPAILEYLEETFREPPLLPADPAARAKVRSIGAIIACDIHPLNNLSTLNYLKSRFEQPQGAVDGWYAHWIHEGFRAVEAMIAAEPYAFGKNVTLADVYLVPQVANARRYNVPLDAYPKIAAAVAACEKLDAFARAHPSRQPDAEG